MLRTNIVRRAGRLLGAVTVSGVLSLGLFAATPVAAHACPTASVSWQANGIKNGSTVTVESYWANGI